MCFICMQLANQLELCLHKQTQIVASAACMVGSQEFHSWIASLPLVSLLFIVIPINYYPSGLSTAIQVDYQPPFK